MNEVERNAGRGFVVRWILLCGFGLGAGLAVGLGLSGPVETLVGMMLVTPVVLALAGSMFGAVQWLAIRRNYRAGLLWIAGSTVGLGAGMTIGVVLVEVVGRGITGEQVRLLTIGPLGRMLGLTLIGAITGLAVGAAQVLALRAYTAPRWARIPWCSVGFGTGLPAGSLVADALLGGLQSAAGMATFLGVAGLIVGAVTVRGAVRIASALPLRRVV